MDRGDSIGEGRGRGRGRGEGRGRGFVFALVATAAFAGCLDGAGPPPAPPPPDDAATPAWPPDLALERVADGFESPTFLLAREGRLLVVEQGGRVVGLDGSVFLDLTDRVLAGGERGLLGLAVDPEDDARVFAHYTDRAGDTVVARYDVQGGRADPATETVVLRHEQPYPNHNGGMIAFGPDGMLYVGLGDGGAAGDPGNRAQDLSTLLGKILRLDVGGDAPGYEIPPDNPFVGREDARPEIWALGLRNPWRFSFDRETGDLWIADVGQGAREEVNWQPAGSDGGENYGWNVWEGTRRFRPGSPTTPATFPVAEYALEDGNCAVTGGYAVRGDAAPALNGTYLYADYCSGRIWGLRAVDGAWTSELLLDTDLRVSSFGEDAEGNVYVVDHGGSVHRVAAG